jgi:predicted O-methyltransferase YrrM
MMFSATLDGLSMRYYTDYLEMLDERNLLTPTLQRAIRPWTAQFICHLFDCNHFNSILEIGRSHGHSFGLFRWLSPDSMIVSIDPHPTDTADQIAALTSGPFQFINSTSDEAFRLGLGTYFDLILIDGNHHEAHARRDWENVLTVASHGAVVIFDNLDHQQGCGKVFHKIEDGGRVKRKFEPCGDQRRWPQGRHYKGTFGVVLLN